MLSLEITSVNIQQIPVQTAAEGEGGREGSRTGR
jgi:hypothetical protein